VSQGVAASFLWLDIFIILYVQLVLLRSSDSSFLLYFFLKKKLPLELNLALQWFAPLLVFGMVPGVLMEHGVQVLLRQFGSYSPE
jgi:hypothetical protein